MSPMQLRYSYQMISDLVAEQVLQYPAPPYLVTQEAQFLGISPEHSSTTTSTTGTVRTPFSSGI